MSKSISKSTMNVPFLSLHDVTAMHGDEIREAARRVIDSGWYLQGKENELQVKIVNSFR